MNPNQQLPSLEKRTEKAKSLSLFLLIFIICAGFSFNAKAADVTVSTTQTFASLDASDGTTDGVFNVSGNLTITGTGWITGDVSGSAATGTTININVTGNLTMLAGAKITSNQITGSCNGGKGGNINIVANNNITTAVGSTIQANGCSGGHIFIHALGANLDINGLVESKGSITGVGNNQPPGGGPITIIGHCELTVNGTVQSIGADPGADLVHLEACRVFVYGLVKSSGAGHVVPTNPPTVLVTTRPDKPANSTAGVEIWADSLWIDKTSPRNGEVVADLTAGAGNRSWIDLFAGHFMTILGRSSGNFAVHANNAGNTPIGGLITLKTVSGTVAAIRRAIQTNGATSGGSGGPVVVQSSADANLTGAIMEAKGGTGTGNGGSIALRSFNGGLLMNASTNLNVTGHTPSNGVVTESSCTGSGVATIVGSVPVIPVVACGGAPVLPAYASTPDPANCSCCVTTVTIQKFVGLPPSNCCLPLIQDWNYTSNIPGHGSFTIHATTPRIIVGVLVGYDGQISFNDVTGGTYTVTETYVPAVPPCPARYIPTNSCMANPATDSLIATIQVSNCASATCQFQNIPSGCIPPPGCQWCTKASCMNQINQNLGNACVIPDILVDVRLPHGGANDVVDITEIHTGEPATWSIQAAVDYVNLHGDPTPGDGQIFIGVTATDPIAINPICTYTCGRPPSTGSPWGTENVIINNLNPQRLNVFGCGVTIHPADAGLPVITVKDGVGKVSVLDLTVAESNVEGYLVQNNADLVIVKDGNAKNNDIGFRIQDNNVELTGVRDISGNRIGVLAEGNNNSLRGNTGIGNNSQYGVVISGNSNESNNNEVGTSGHANGAGMLISGSLNNIHDGKVKYNTGDGFVVTGNTNTLNDIDVDHNGGKGFRVSGSSNILTNNKQTKNNVSDGFYVSGTSNQLTSNESDNNGGNGIIASSAIGAVNTNLMSNVAKNNALQGIRACLQNDQGGNSASGNLVNPQIAFTGCLRLANEVNSTAENSMVNFYPNPTKGNAMIEFVSTTASAYTINITDMTGRLIMIEVINAKEGFNMHQVDLTSLAKGMYMLTVQNPSMKEVKRISVQ